MRNHSGRSTEDDADGRASSHGDETLDRFVECEDRLAGGNGSRSLAGRLRIKGRSKSTSRADEKPKKTLKYLDTASASLSNIPNRIQLSLLRSGLISITDEQKAIPSMCIRPYPALDHSAICAEHNKHPVLYKVEYHMTAKVEPHSIRHAMKETNVDKNTNKKIVPYDYNRVVLDPLPDTPDSDYINASYVDSLLTPKYYIAAQGPRENTIADFWRMVWQMDTRLIIMLTKTFDFIKVMCVQYWPANIGTSDEYFGIKVELLAEEELANFQIRTMKITRKGEVRTIYQYHYTGWPSHTQPFINALLEFRRRLTIWRQTCMRESDGPPVVHCSDGGGRTGVFLAIDANLQLLDEDGQFDIYGYVKRLRQARRGLVENPDQFRFIYEALEEHLICGNSYFPVSELSKVLKHKAVKDITGKNEYQKEYDTVCKMTPRFTIGDCAGGHRADNRFKNRNVLCVPPDNFRPYLTSFQGNCCTDYINSVFIDGYNQPREYIVTEWPIPNSLGDIWSLVYDYDCCGVVVLCNPPVTANYPPFWPDKQQSLKYGPVFTLEHQSHEHYDNIRTWVFKLHKKIVSLTELMAGIKAEVKTFQLFQLMCWPQGHKVPSSTNALVELMNMVEKWRQKTGYGPVIVVTPDGMSRAGVYCAANACIEQVVQHGEVDVFQAVRTVRRHRPQLVNSMTEYKYCYDLMLHYVLHFLQKEVKP